MGVLSAVNTRMVTPTDFVQAGRAVAMTPPGRKALLRADQQRMDTLVTHPLFGYRVSYRRVLEIQTRLLARVVTGEIAHYPGFETRSLARAVRRRPVPGHRSRRGNWRESVIR